MGVHKVLRMLPWMYLIIRFRIRDIWLRTNTQACERTEISIANCESEIGDVSDLEALTHCAWYSLFWVSRWKRENYQLYINIFYVRLVHELAIIVPSKIEHNPRKFKSINLVYRKWSAATKNKGINLLFFGNQTNLFSFLAGNGPNLIKYWVVYFVYIKIKFFIGKFRIFSIMMSVGSINFAFLTFYRKKSTHPGACHISWIREHFSIIIR